MKYKNVSKSVKSFKIGDEWLSIDPGKEFEVPVNNIHIREEGIEKVEDVVPTEEELKDILQATEKEQELIDKKLKEENPLIKNLEEKEYSKTDLIDMNKDQQVAILKDIGLKPAEIKKLSNEKKRVDKILKMQDGKKK